MTTPFTIWCTGLPGSGLSKLSTALSQALTDAGHPASSLDSSAWRRTPAGASLGFSPSDRDTNMTRLGEEARELMATGRIAVVGAVSPYRESRDRLRSELGAFVEVHVSTPIAQCIDGDKTGNWARALKGELRGFTGIDAPYEIPENAELSIDLSELTVSDGARRVFDHLKAAGSI